MFIYLDPNVYILGSHGKVMTGIPKPFEACSLIKLYWALWVASLSLSM